MGVKFGDAVRTARIGQKIPLKRVAEELDFSIPYLSDIERGHRNPPTNEKVRAWAGLIGLNVEDLVLTAINDRPRVELPVEGQRQGKVDIAYSLARSWDEMSPAEEERLLKVLKEMEHEGE